MTNRLVRYSDPIFGSDFVGDFFSRFTQQDPLRVRTKHVDNGLELELTLPGLSKEEIDLSVKNSSLHLKVEKEEMYCSRSWSLPQNAQIEDISADLKNGILIIKVPIKEDVRKIDIKS